MNTFRIVGDSVALNRLLALTASPITQMTYYLRTRSNVPQMILDFPDANKHLENFFTVGGNFKYLVDVEGRPTWASCKEDGLGDS